MTVKLKVVMMVFACCSYQSQAEDLNALKVKEYRLENGLTVWLNEDRSALVKPFAEEASAEP